MAVYRRTYTSYSGALTPAWSRWRVLFRYSRSNLFRSKLQTALFVLCFFFPLLCLLSIYLVHNLSFLEKLDTAGCEPKSAPPAEFAGIIKSDVALWAKVVKDAGISAE